MTGLTQILVGKLWFRGWSAELFPPLPHLYSSQNKMIFLSVVYLSPSVKGLIIPSRVRVALILNYSLSDSLKSSSADEREMETIYLWEKVQVWFGL